MRISQDGILEGETVFLRPITTEDTELIIRWRNSDEVRKYFIYQEPFTLEGHLKWLETMVDGVRGWQFIICLKDGGIPIGSAYLRDIDPVCRKAEYGVFIGEASRKGQGIGSEAVKLTVSFAFRFLKLHKVFARVYADNTASLRSFEKSGFMREALLRDEVYVNGSFRDIIFLAILNSEQETAAPEKEDGRKPACAEEDNIG